MRRLIAQDFDQAFEACDLILGPVSPKLAWRMDEMNAQDPLSEFLADIYTSVRAGRSAWHVPALWLR